MKQNLDENIKKILITSNKRPITANKRKLKRPYPGPPTSINQTLRTIIK